MLRMQMDAMGPFPRKMLRKSKFWQRHFHTQTFYFQQICIDEVSQQVRHTTRHTHAHMTQAHTNDRTHSRHAIHDTPRANRST
jgi:hypothetical protein